MPPFYPTLILRHRKENLKKCSLRGLEGRSDLTFLTYPLKTPLPDLSSYVALSLDAPPLTSEDAQRGLFLIDGTWRYAQKMAQVLPKNILKRSLPPIPTAYPRRQEDCPDPSRGLASVEALAFAYKILGWDPEGLLDHYFWKEGFLENLEKNGH